MTEHPYHCMWCGHQLTEMNLGLLGCRSCGSVFYPFVDEQGAPSISCIDSNKIITLDKAKGLFNNDKE